MASIRYQLSLLAICMVLIPWSIVAVTAAHCWLTPAAPAANVNDLLELQALDSALKAYARLYWEYPPDFTSDDIEREIDEHLSLVFPFRDAKLDAIDVRKFGPQNALTFWLSGFSDDPKRPLTGNGRQPPLYHPERSMTGKRLRQPLYRFDRDRMAETGEYSPEACRAPYVYFCHRTYDYGEYSGKLWSGTAKPYLSGPRNDTSKSFIQPGGYQIISAGNDGVYGYEQIAASEAPRDVHHADNLTNFCQQALGETLGPQPQFGKRSILQQRARLSTVIAIVCLVTYPVAAYQLGRRTSRISRLRQLVAKQTSAEFLEHR
jgi:hypothetical protein